MIIFHLRLQHDDVDPVDCDDGDGSNGDGKWRPAILIMAILYKVGFLE